MRQLRFGEIGNNAYFAWPGRTGDSGNIGKMGDHGGPDGFGVELGNLCGG